MNLSWPEFFQATKDRPHWPLVERAITMLGYKGHALDLGCGAGRDTRYLLSQGWRVTAVDREADAIALLAELPQENLTSVQSSIQDFSFEPEEYDVVSAQFSLPFLPRTVFFESFRRLRSAIKPGGLFVGQFFGVNDSWNTPEYDMTFLTREEVDEVLDGLKVVEITEEENPGTTALGESKHWHVYHVMAQRLP
jgi:tellurite methyltransferase